MGSVVLEQLNQYNCLNKVTRIGLKSRYFLKMVAEIICETYGLGEKQIKNKIFK